MRYKYYYYINIYKQNTPWMIMHTWVVTKQLQFPGVFVSDVCTVCDDLNVNKFAYNYVNFPNLTELSSNQLREKYGMNS